jgi:hypothetical protein
MTVIDSKERIGTGDLGSFVKSISSHFPELENDSRIEKGSYLDKFLYAVANRLFLTARSIAEEAKYCPEVKSALNEFEGRYSTDSFRSLVNMAGID